MIKKVKLQNFMSYTDETISFAGGFNVIEGKNGSGKTAVINAIGLALFGYSPYKLDSLVRYGEKTARVSVEFQGKDGQSYRADRTIGSSPNIKVSGNDTILAVGKTDVSQFVASHFGLSPDIDLSDIAKNGVIAPQGSIITPFRLPNTQRKAMFDGVLAIDQYEKAFRDMAPAIRVIKTKGMEVGESIAGLQGQLVRYDAVLEQLDKIDIELSGLPSLGRFQGELNRLKESIAKLAATKEEWLEMNSRLTLVKRDLLDAKKETGRLLDTIEVTEEEVALCLRAEEKLPELEESLAEKERLEQHLTTTIEDYTKRAGTLEASLENLRKQLKSLNQIDSPACPICNKPLEEQEKEELIEDITNVGRELRTSLELLSTESREARAFLNMAIGEHRDAPSELAVAQDRATGLTRFRNALDALQAKLVLPATGAVALEERKRRLQKMVDELARTLAEGEIDILEREHTTLVGKIASVEARQESLLRQRSDLTDEGLELEAKNEILLEKKEVLTELTTAKENAEAIRVAIRTAGPLVAARLVEKISASASVLFSEMMSAHEVDASLTWTGEYGIVTKIGGVELDIRDDPVNGGKAQLAALAVRLALLQELSQVGFIILDEPTANLDGPAMSMLGASIKEISSRFNQIVVISHDQTFAPHADHSVSLVNRGGETVVQ